jgi:hypothetical protein
MASAEHLVLDLSNPELRENALLELSKVPNRNGMIRFDHFFINILSLPIYCSLKIRSFLVHLCVGNVGVGVLNFLRDSGFVGLTRKKIGE